MEDIEENIIEFSVNKNFKLHDFSMTFRILIKLQKRGIIKSFSVSKDTIKVHLNSR